MIKRAFVTAALLATAASSIPVQAQLQQPPIPTTQNDRRICRPVSRIGSRLARTVTCHTQTEWDEIAAESRRTADRIQRVASACMMGPNEPGKAHIVCSN
jgi:hypothetical protein